MGIYPYIVWIEASERSGSAELSDALAQTSLDKVLRQIVLRAIESIEKQAKAQYRNSMVSRYGDFCLYDPAPDRSAGSSAIPWPDDAGRLAKREQMYYYC